MKKFTLLMFLILSLASVIWGQGNKLSVNLIARASYDKINPLNFIYSKIQISIDSTFSPAERFSEESDWIRSEPNSLVQYTYNIRLRTIYYWRGKTKTQDDKESKWSEIFRFKVVKGKSHKFDGVSIFPNPFNERANISYTLSEKSKVRIEIHNLLGQLIIKLVDIEQEEGFYNIIWDGKNKNNEQTASGIYFLVTKVNGVTDKKFIVLIK